MRVHTLALPVTDSISAAFKAADVDAQMVAAARTAAAGVPGGTLQARLPSRFLLAARSRSHPCFLSLSLAQL